MSGVIYTVRPDGLLREANSIEQSARENQKVWIVLGQLDRYDNAMKTARMLRHAAAEKSVYTRREILRNAGYTVKTPKAISAKFKTNPRPRKYANDAEKQAAFRARAAMLEFRADEKTAATLIRIAQEIDVSRNDLLLSMVKFALTNHDWARFGLTHKVLPKYQENPMATRKTNPEAKMTKFTYKAVTYNGRKGYVATRWIKSANAWVYSGESFGTTQKKARENFENVNYKTNPMVKPESSKNAIRYAELFNGNPGTLKSWDDHYLVQFKYGSGTWSLSSAFVKRDEAESYARSLARKNPTWYVRVVLKAPGK